MLRLGIAGLGIAAQQVLPGFDAMADVVSVAAVADVRADALREVQSRRPGVLAFDSVEAMCASPDIDAVWVATPNQLHARHAVCAAENGKHIVCEKPMATSIDECNQIVAAVERHGVKYVQGHSKAYQEPLAIMRRVIDGGSIGRPTQISTWNYNDWLLRPSIEGERRTENGTGPVFRQGPHQIDIVRFLAGVPMRSVRAVTGRWEVGYPETESNFSALFMFENGLAATVVFNAQGYFDAAEMTWGFGEGGYRMLNADSVYPRERRTSAMTINEKQGYLRAGDPYGRGWGGGEDRASLPRQPFFGLTIVSCERGLVRQSPDGVYVYDANGRREVSCVQPVKRGESEVRELIASIAENRAPVLDAYWGRATLEACVAMLESSKQQREIELLYQAVLPNHHSEATV
jgi:phthalate 4,5-cis-dihydrodiol dehydrogenase